MVEEEGLQGPRDELLAQLGFQHLDMERWPECDPGPEPPKNPMQQLMEAISSVGVSVRQLGEQMGIPVAQHRDIAGPLAHFEIGPKGKITQLVPIKGIGTVYHAGCESVTTSQMFLEQEDRKPNLNKNGPVRDPHRRHGRG